MSILQNLTLALCTGLFVFLLGGCEREGPAERAGEEVDEAVEEAEEAVRPERD